MTKVAKSATQPNGKVQGNGRGRGAVKSKCPSIGRVPHEKTSSSTSLSVQKMKLAALESLREDNATRTDPRMALAGQHFLECDGIETLYRVVGHRESNDEHAIADDARRPKRSLHRSAYPLAKFLHIHIGNQPNRLGASVARRLMFGKLMNGRSPPSSPALKSKQKSRSKSLSRSRSREQGEGLLDYSAVSSPRRIRASWNVSPLMFRIIVAFTKIHKRNWPVSSPSRRRKNMLGGRLLGTGRNETKVYTFDDLAQEHPEMHGACLHMYSSTIPQPPLCFDGRDAHHVMQLVTSSVSAVPFLSGIAIKDILDDEDAGTELQYHQRIHRWFSEAHSLHLTCLHPHLHYIQVDDGRIKPQGVTESGGRKLLVTRLLYGDVHHLYLREEEMVDLSISVLQGLQVFHDHHQLHMDIKPENILWDTDQRDRRMFCLSDYNLVMSDASVLHFLRPDDGGGFQSLSHGTEGYKSPLLMLDDLKGNTYHTFGVVASKSRAFPKNLMPVWREYFDKFRLTTSTAKIDLHSLALTLYKLAVPHGQDKKVTLKLLKGPFGKFVAKLMFFRPHDFSTATDALIYLKSNSRTRSRSHVAPGKTL